MNFSGEASNFDQLIIKITIRCIPILKMEIPPKNPKRKRYANVFKYLLMIKIIVIFPLQTIPVIVSLRTSTILTRFYLLFSRSALHSLRAFCQKNVQHV